MDYEQYSPSQHYPQPHRHRIPVLKIIGTILLVLILICGGLVTYVAYNFPRWAASFARGPLVAEIEKADLPAEQKALLKHNITRVADAFEQGRMSFTQFKAILTNLASGPFFNLVQVEAIRHQYELAHPQSDDERAETMLLFDRFLRGIAEGAIPRGQIEEMLVPMREHNSKQRDGDNRLTEAELNQFIDAMRLAVESANIPAEPFQPDYATEIDKAVTAVLGPGRSAVTTAPAADSAGTAPAEPMPAETAPAER